MRKLITGAFRAAEGYLSLQRTPRLAVVAYDGLSDATPNVSSG